MSLNEELIEASKRGDIGKVTDSVEQGVEIDASAKFDFTPLMYASMNGYLEIVKFLVVRGSDVNKKNQLQ